MARTDRNPNPKYLNLEQDMNIYLKEDDDIPGPKVFRETEKEETIREKKVFSRVATPRLEEESIETLKRKSPKVIGGIFDRITFLKQRVEECQKAMELRKGIHEDMVADIKSDIKEKEEIERRLTDITDKRNFRMDISALRKEMRAETVRFWKDLLELRTELSELLEQYQTESKIVDTFRDIERDGLML